MALAPIISPNHALETESPETGFGSELDNAFIDAAKQQKKKNDSDDSLSLPTMTILVSLPVALQDRKMQPKSKVSGSVEMQAVDVKNDVKAKKELTLNVIASALHFSAGQQLSIASLSTLTRQSFREQRTVDATAGVTTELTHELTQPVQSVTGASVESSLVQAAQVMSVLASGTTTDPVVTAPVLATTAMQVNPVQVVTPRIDGVPVEFMPSPQIVQGAGQRMSIPGSTTSDTVVNTPVISAPTSPAVSAQAAEPRTSGVPVEFTSSKQAVQGTPVPEPQVAPVTKSKAASDTVVSTPASATTAMQAVVGQVAMSRTDSMPVEFKPFPQGVQQAAQGASVPGTTADTVMTTPLAPAQLSPVAPELAATPRALSMPVEFTSFQQTAQVAPVPMSQTASGMAVTKPASTVAAQATPAQVATPRTEFMLSQQAVQVTPALVPKGVPVSTTTPDTVMTILPVPAQPSSAAPDQIATPLALSTPVEFTLFQQAAKVMPAPVPKVAPVAVSTTTSDTVVTTPLVPAQPPSVAPESVAAPRALSTPVQFTSFQQVVQVMPAPVPKVAPVAVPTTTSDTPVTPPLASVQPLPVVPESAATLRPLSTPVEFTPSQHVVQGTSVSVSKGVPVAVSMTTSDTVVTTPPVPAQPSSVIPEPVATPRALSTPVEFMSSQQAVQVTPALVSKVVPVPALKKTSDTARSVPASATASLPAAPAQVATPHVSGMPAELVSHNQIARATIESRIQSTLQNPVASTPSAPTVITPQTLFVQGETRSASAQLAKQEFSEMTSALPVMTSSMQAPQQSYSAVPQEQPVTTQIATKQQAEVLVIRDKNAEVPKDTRVSFLGGEVTFSAPSEMGGRKVTASDDHTQILMSYGEIPAGIDSVESSIDKQPKQRQSTNQYHADDADE